LVNSIEQNQFLFTGDTIKLAPSGRLLDGQHRLAAIAQSGITQRLLVVFNVPEEAFQVIDRGAPRSNGDMVNQMGLPYANNIAAAARLAVAYGARQAGHKEQMSKAVLPHHVRTEVERHGGLYVEASELAYRAAREVPGLNKSAITALYVIVSRERKRTDEVVQFINGMITLEGLVRADARIALRQALANSLKPRTSSYLATMAGSRQNHVQLAMLVRTFNLWLNGERRKVLKAWHVGDEFPTVDTTDTSEVLS
jgi:hypothetical protein